MDELRERLEEAEAAIKAAETSQMMMMQHQFKYFKIFAFTIVTIVFFFSLVLGFQAYLQYKAETEMLYEISYEAIGTMGDSNNINTGEGNIYTE